MTPFEFWICHPIDDWLGLNYFIRKILFRWCFVTCMLESKHLVICNSEVLGACEERALLSWWELIGAAEMAATITCVCIIWYT